ncbi:MAG TPA: hypothetical protein VN740_07665 [Solirubrobacteraceae bacterium]|nr:hypothetical protein [Solirubrobacteraceae bacterium]
MPRRPHSLRPRAALAIAAAALTAAAGFGVDAALAAHKTISRSQASAVATAVNLRHSDLPTLKQQANPITPAERQSSAAVDACIGESSPSQALADIQSPDFVGPSPTQLTVNSETQILPSAGVVASDLAAIRRPHALICLRDALGKALVTTAPKGSTFSVSVARLPATLPGTDGVAAVRVTAIFHVKSGSTTVTVPAYVDDVGFAYGQAEVALDVVSTTAPPSSSLETRLAVLLVARARAAIG